MESPWNSYFNENSQAFTAATQFKKKSETQLISTGKAYKESEEVDNGTVDAPFSYPYITCMNAACVFRKNLQDQEGLLVIEECGKELDRSIIYQWQGNVLETCIIAQYMIVYDQ